MDIVFRLHEASASQIHNELPDAPHPAAVRTLLRILERKGHLAHRADGRRHLYFAATTRRTAQRSARRHLVRTVCGGSRAAAVAALVDDGESPLRTDERKELARAVARLRSQGR